jgi:hypothetical protein
MHKMSEMRMVVAEVYFSDVRRKHVRPLPDDELFERIGGFPGDDGSDPGSPQSHSQGNRQRRQSNELQAGYYGEDEGILRQLVVKRCKFAIEFCSFLTSSRFLCGLCLALRSGRLLGLLRLALRLIAALRSPLRLRSINDRQCRNGHDGREKTPS